MTENERNLVAKYKDGDASACFYLGLMYANGDGVEANAATAADWYQKGAKLGDPDCKLNLSCAYINGSGVAQDLSLGLKYAIEASAENTFLENAAIASINAAIVYRISDQHKNWSKCIEYCKLAIEQNPEYDNAYFQLCLSTILSNYVNAMAAPLFLDEKGNYLTGKFERHPEIREAIEKYYARLGLEAYEKLAAFFEDLYNEEGIYSGHNLSAAQFYKMIERERPFDFTDPEQQVHINHVAELYVSSGFPNQLEGHDYIIELARNGYDLAYNFLHRNCCDYYVKKTGNSMREIAHKAALVGWQAHESRFEAVIEDRERLADPSKTDHEIERLSFSLAVGYEKAFWKFPSRYSYGPDTAKTYYLKLKEGNPFARLSLARIIECEITKAQLEDEPIAPRAAALGKALSNAVSQYFAVSATYDEAYKSEKMIAALRILELLQMKSKKLPSALAGDVFEKESFDKIASKLLPFKPNTKNLMDVKIQGDFVPYEDHRDYSIYWHVYKEDIYACRSFDFMYRVPARYDANILSHLCIDKKALYTLIDSLANIFDSPETFKKILLYLYQTEGSLPKQHAQTVLEYCESISKKDPNTARKSAADYALFNLYYGTKGIKKDKKKALFHLADAARGGNADAQLEAALFAKKGKLAEFGIGKSDFKTFLALSAENGNEKAKSMLK